MDHYRLIEILFARLCIRVCPCYALGIAFLDQLFRTGGQAR